MIPVCGTLGYLRYLRCLRCLPKRPPLGTCLRYLTFLQRCRGVAPASGDSLCVSHCRAFLLCSTFLRSTSSNLPSSLFPFPLFLCYPLFFSPPFSPLLFALVSNCPYLSLFPFRFANKSNAQFDSLKVGLGSRVLVTHDTKVRQNTIDSLTSRHGVFVPSSHRAMTLALCVQCLTGKVTHSLSQPPLC